VTAPLIKSPYIWSPDPLGPCGFLRACCFTSATILRLLLGARPSLGRPSTVARLEILSPHEGEVFRGDRAAIPVHLQLDGGKIAPFTSLRLVPNEGHIHLYLDGSLVSMARSGCPDRRFTGATRVAS
jgi:hypothetical protein